MYAYYRNYMCATRKIVGTIAFEEGGGTDSLEGGAEMDGYPVCAHYAAMIMRYESQPIGCIHPTVGRTRLLNGPCEGAWAIEPPCRFRQATSSEDRGLDSKAEGDRELGGAVSSLHKFSSGCSTATPTDILPVLCRPRRRWSGRDGHDREGYARATLDGLVASGEMREAFSQRVASRDPK
ncbi:hypothetical protein L210DRAFT_3499628 [Boletus edulis BED1]|uniref:Uncharacterized protein n=1 Tax=Boletus edulis BED1 TaxID=1328754 RepID=A0AAD4GMF2_BOLED|nr:hypothetical protein L210DRAFT_3499628 [Boletus edulis BED1]